MKFAKVAVGSNLDNFIDNETQPKRIFGNVVIDFYADWCNPCRRLSPILEKLATEHTNVLFFKINFDNARNLSERYRIRGIPTLLLFKDGQKVDQVTGLLNKSEYASLFNRVFPR